MTFTMRPCLAEDHEAVGRLVEAAFGGTDEALLVDRLRRDGDAAIELVAEAGGQVVGHALFSPMGAPFRALALAPLAVAPARQRRGIGDSLVREGLRLARSGGWDGVFVLGDPRYYGRFGFEAALAEGFACTYAGPHLMARSLGAELPAHSGTLTYAGAFAALGPHEEPR